MFVEKNVYHDRTTTSEDRTPGRNLNSHAFPPAEY
jgi:hypothetical protein